MKRLVLVRHATAVDVGPKGSDFHRKLKKRGRREAAIMADRVAVALGVPDALVSSPADRALETARAFAGRLGSSGEIMIREDLYGGLLPEEFLHIVRGFDDGHDTVMVFGHDPSFSEFAAYLVPGFKELIPKAGVVAIGIDRKSWGDVTRGDGVVATFERPPAPEIQKRIEEDLIDRLATKIRSAVFEAIRSFGVPENRDVVKSVARASSRLAVTVRPFAATGNELPEPSGVTRGRALTKRRAKKAAKGPRRVASTRVPKRRTRSRA